MDRNKFVEEYAYATPIVNEDRMVKLLKQSLISDKEFDHIPIMCMEELAELTQAVSKSIRKGTTESHINLVEEIADAYIAINYMFYRFDVEMHEVGKAINVKLNRLERKLKENGRYE